MKINELEFRLKMAQLAVNLLMGEETTPEVESALEYYSAQRDELQQTLNDEKKKLEQSEIPPDIVIKMKTAVITPITGRK